MELGWNDFTLLFLLCGETWYPIFSHIAASVMAVNITSRNTGLVTLDTGDPEMDFYILFCGLGSGFRFGPFMF